MKKLDFLKVSFMVRSDKKDSGLSSVLMMLFLDGRRAYISTGLIAELKMGIPDLEGLQAILQKLISKLNAWIG